MLLVAVHSDTVGYGLKPIKYSHPHASTPESMPGRNTCVPSELNATGSRIPFLVAITRAFSTELDR